MMAIYENKVPTPMSSCPGLSVWLTCSRVLERRPVARLLASLLLVSLLCGEEEGEGREAKMRLEGESG